MDNEKRILLLKSKLERIRLNINNEKIIVGNIFYHSDNEHHKDIQKYFVFQFTNYPEKKFINTLIKLEPSYIKDCSEYFYFNIPGIQKSYKSIYNCVYLLTEYNKKVIRDMIHEIYMNEKTKKQFLGQGVYLFFLDTYELCIIGKLSSPKCYRNPNYVIMLKEMYIYGTKKIKNDIKYNVNILNHFKNITIRQNLINYYKIYKGEPYKFNKRDMLDEISHKIYEYDVKRFYKNKKNRKIVLYI